MKNETNIAKCVDCQKLTLKTELEENARYGGYSFKRICDNCAEKIEDEMDKQQGN